MKYHVKIVPFLAIIVFVVILFGIGLYRIEIDMDITTSLPKKERVIDDAAYIFRNNPIQDRIFIDVALSKDDLGRLYDCATFIEGRLKSSGLFKSVGMQDVADVIPDMLSHIMKNLPVMFTENEINKKIKPMLEIESVKRTISNNYYKLLDLKGIGQAEFISKDPLNLAGLVMEKLSGLAPSKGASVFKGRLLSMDKRHVLIFAQPESSGTDTSFARKITRLINEISDDVNRKFFNGKDKVFLTPMGAYRAALDNEVIIKKDVNRALIFAVAGIGILLLFAFPRPMIGLLSFLPAIFGTMVAFFFFSMIYKSISIMVLGFGGAIISITVDQGIAYLLFLDRPYETYGKEASAEIWSVGLIAVLTTVGAFGLLIFSDFPIFEQLGLFTALGILFSFIFVHTFFPLVIPLMPPAKTRFSPLEKFVDKFACSGKKGAFFALIFACVMLPFAKPEFDVTMKSMNTVKMETVAAEEKFAEVWGNIFNKVYILTEGKNFREFQNKNDRVLSILEQDRHSNVIASGFLSSMIFPGEDRKNNNFKAWKKFWNLQRVDELKKNMDQVAKNVGFAQDAFLPFYTLLDSTYKRPENGDIPEKFHNMLGISRSNEGFKLSQCSGLTPGASYNAEEFFDRYESISHIFDPGYFSHQLGKLLFSTFTKMLILIGISVSILLFIFFLDWKLTLVSLLPIAFALVSTLGTLNLMGHSLTIPGLMLSIVIFGMGIDYSLFFVRSYQRYQDAFHPSFSLIRLAVFMASASTIIGFGVLCFSEHSLLKSAGFTSLLGIGYSLLGAFLILPAVMERLILNRRIDGKKDKTHLDRVLARYKNMEAYPRLFARFKMKFDPMFIELPKYLKPIKQAKKIIDIGCGYGIPACWLIELLPDAAVYGIDPSANRVRVASKVLGKRGLVSNDRAPNIPLTNGSFDLAVMLDIVHYLNDNDLKNTLERLYCSLNHGGVLIIRAVLPPEGRFSILRKLEELKLHALKLSTNYRSVKKLKKFILNAGFNLKFTENSGSKGDLIWLIAQKKS